MSHSSRRGGSSGECPLASLGRNSPSMETGKIYHHPLSSSPLDPQVYQMSRKSPILEINTTVAKNNRLSAAVSATTQQQHVTILKPPAAPPALRSSGSSTAPGPNTKLYHHQSQSSTSSVEQSVYGMRAMHPAAYHHRPRSTTPNHPKTSYRLSDHDRCSSNNDSQSESNQYYINDKLNSFYLDQTLTSSERYYLEDNLNMCHYPNSNSDKHAQKTIIRRASSPSETSESDRYMLEPMNNLKLANSNATTPFQIARYNTNSPQCFINGLSRICRYSPTFDQGYHTLVSPSPTGQQTPGPWNKRSNNYESGDSFDRLPDDVVLKIFGWIDNCKLCKIARVCRRFEVLIWKPVLWKVIRLKNNMDGDKALKTIFKRLCRQTRSGNCLGVEHILLSEGCKVTDKGLHLLSRKCPELTHLQIQFSATITNSAITNVLTQCSNLQHLDITGCTIITHLDTHPSLEEQMTRQLHLQYLDLTDCTAITDNGLKIIVQNCPQLIFVYLRRCIQITDTGLKHIPSFCVTLRELSVSDCSNITDFGLYELAKLGATLRYLSVAKCDKISDAGLKQIARRCYKLRYLNARGCEAVSDDSITVLANSCPRLRALDLGKCDVSDTGLRALAESCPNLKKLGLRNCDMITDVGIQCIAYFCRGLQQLNIQDCQITIEGYRAVKKYCKRCVIEHTNPGFC